MIWVKWFLKTGNCSGRNGHMDSKSGYGEVLISFSHNLDDSRSGFGSGSIGIKSQSVTKTLRQRGRELNDAL